MQNFQYNYFKKKYSDKAEVLLTDTDSDTTKSEAKNAYKDFYKDKELFDFNNYLGYSHCFNNAINLVVEKIKNETGGLSRKRGFQTKIQNVQS